MCVALVVALVDYETVAETVWSLFRQTRAVFQLVIIRVFTVAWTDRPESHPARSSPCILTLALLLVLSQLLALLYPPRDSLSRPFKPTA